MAEQRRAKPRKTATTKPTGTHKHFNTTPSKTPHGVRYFKLGEGLDYAQMREEISEYKDVLMGRKPPPIDVGTMTLMEVAEAYHARAMEIQMELQELENQGVVLRGSNPYRFRTGYLRSFIELTSKTIDLGSRRVTYERDVLNGRG